jgi:hypothetical protein
MALSEEALCKAARSRDLARVTHIELVVSRADECLADLATQLPVLKVRRAGLLLSLLVGRRGRPRVRARALAIDGG